MHMIRYPREPGLCNRKIETFGTPGPVPSVRVPLFRERSHQQVSGCSWPTQARAASYFLGAREVGRKFRPERFQVAGKEGARGMTRGAS